jgi:hypothetical protein
MTMTSSAQVLLGTLPFIFLVGFALLRFCQGRDRAASAVEALVAWGVISNVASEILGQFHLVSFFPFLALWLIAAGAVCYFLWQTRSCVAAFFIVERGLPFTIVAAIATVTLFIALTAAANNWDSQAYHLPRIEHWIQNGTLAYYPSWNVRQNEFAPLSELLLLQTRILSGSDFYYLLIHWISMVTCIAAVFRITGQLGGNRTQCWIAAVFLATLPIGILESTSTQNDYLEATFLIAFVTLGIEAIREPRVPLGLILAAAAAGVMTGLVKPIGFMIGAGFALWFAVGLSAGATIRAWLGRMVAIALIAAVLIVPFAHRFVTGAQFSDLESMHFSSSFGIKQTLDTLIRHSISNLAIGIPEFDNEVVRIAEALTFRIGLQTYRADTSDPLRPNYVPPEGLLIYHEDLGPNQPHMLLFTLALIGLAIGWPTRLTRLQLIYGAAWLGGILVFCSFMRFSLWEVRYHLPGFAAGAPLVALAWPARWSGSRKTTALLLVLALACIPVLLLNQSRELVPLWRTQFPSLGRDRLSYLSQTRLERQFINQPQMLAPYQDAVDTIVRARVSQIGLIMDRDNFEYPIWLMLRQRTRVHPIRIEAVGIPDQTHWLLGPFTPDMIFWDKGTGEAPETLSVRGQEFRRISQSGPLIGHDSQVAVYERIQAR